MAYTNSSLVNYKKLSPNHSGKRNHAIDTVSIHCVVGQLSVETLGNLFANKSRQASCNYGIGSDGRIALIVEEKNRSWCTSSSSNDNRAITIEVASDTTHPYAVNDKAYASLIKLLADICKRNGIKQLKWEGNKNLIGNIARQNMTVHRWFKNKACPGDWLYSRHGQIANEVNALLGVNSSYSSTPVTSVSKPAASTSSSSADSSVLAWQKAAKADGFRFPKYGLDGKWGSECTSVASAAIVKDRNTYRKGKVYRTNYKYKNLTKIVQRAVGVEADGLCGSNTRAAIVAYQKKKGLAQDGCVGLKTWRKILGV